MSGGALSDKDAKFIAEGLSTASLQTLMAHINATGRLLAEEYEPPRTPAQTLRDAANYLGAVNVKLRPDDLAYVVDFLNVYADQLEGSE